MNGNLVRCTNSYFASKGTKSFRRMLFFNLIRCMIPELLKEFIFRGKLVVWEFSFVFCCACMYTTLYHFLPISVFAHFRYFYSYLQLEYYCKHAGDWIDNRNQLEVLWSHNFCAFFVFLYLESNSMLTAAMFEGLAYGEISVWDLPYTVYDGAFTYICAIPATYMLQTLLLGATLTIHIPTSFSGLFWDKRHISGWVDVEMISASYDWHWLYWVLIHIIFISLSAYYDVYRRIAWLTDYVEKSERQALKDQNAHDSCSSPVAKKSSVAKSRSPTKRRNSNTSAGSSV